MFDNIIVAILRGVVLGTIGVFTFSGTISCDGDSIGPVDVGADVDSFDTLTSPRIVDESRALATVNGDPIYREDLVSYLAAGVMADTEDAILDQVIRTFLLAQEARRRGHEKETNVAIAFKKALAFALLEQKGNAFTEKSIDESTLKMAFERQKKKRFVHGEIRTVAHALVFAPKGKTISEDERRLAERIRKKVAGADSESAFRDAVDETKKEVESAFVKVEKLPPFDSESTTFVAPFVKGTFGIAYPEERVSGLVETRFGIHIIFVVSSREAANVSFSEARDILAKEMVAVERAKHIEAFIDNLKKDEDIFVYDETLAESVAAESVADEDERAR